MKEIFRNECKELLKIVQSSSFFKKIVVSENFLDNNPDDQFSFYFKQGRGWFYNQNRASGFNINSKPVSCAELDIINKLQNLTDDAEVVVSPELPEGTSCGSLFFSFGWIHQKDKKRVAEVIMPQSNDE